MADFVYVNVTLNTVMNATTNIDSIGDHGDINVMLIRFCVMK